MSSLVRRRKRLSIVQRRNSLTKKFYRVNIRRWQLWAQILLSLLIHFECDYFTSLRLASISRGDSLVSMPMNEYSLSVNILEMLFLFQYFLWFLFIFGSDASLKPRLWGECVFVRRLVNFDFCWRRGEKKWENQEAASSLLFCVALWMRFWKKISWESVRGLRHWSGASLGENFLYVINRQLG